MDLVRLGAAYTTAYIPDLLIEGYNSLIWTERFDEFGEFELKSFDVDRVLAQLPEDTLLSHLETREVMIVETHSIAMVGEGTDAVPEITVKGRSALMILIHRFIESTYQTKRKMRKKYTATDALTVLLWHAIDNNTGKDVTRGDSDPDTSVGNDYSWSTQDDIPNVGVTETVTSEGSTRWFLLEEGSLWPQFQKIMQSAGIGIRLIRPVSPNPRTIVSVDSTLATRGNIITTASADFAGLVFEIYDGVDRSATVKFSQLQGHLEKPTYLMSKQNYDSQLEVMTAVPSVPDIYRPGESGFTGWQRRSMSWDAGNPELPTEPEKPEDLDESPTSGERHDYYVALTAWKTKMVSWRAKRDAIWADFREEVAIQGFRELRKNRRINMFDGDISILAPYKYKVHYDLGDKVTFRDDYGRTTTHVIAEYVRTEDASGDRGFPGFVEP